MPSRGNVSSQEDLPLDMSGINDDVMIIFLWIVYGCVCLVINAFGIVTNIINIICFVKQGFQDSVNVSLFALSFSDLCCLITLSFLNVSWTPALTTADLTFDPTEVTYLVALTPHFIFSRVTNWITALITLERCLCVLAPLKIKSIFTSRRTAMIIICFSIIFVCTAAPVYAVNKLEMKFSPLRNKTIFGLTFTENRNFIQKIIFLINNFSIPLTAFTVTVICTLALVIKLHNTQKWRRKSTASAQSDRASSRSQKAAKMVVMISSLFIACFTPINITVMVSAFKPEISYGGKYIKIGVMLGGFSFVLESINSSANIFIYYYMSSKYRDNFRKIFSIDPE